MMRVSWVVIVLREVVNGGGGGGGGSGERGGHVVGPPRCYILVNGGRRTDRGQLCRLGRLSHRRTWNEET